MLFVPHKYACPGGWTTPYMVDSSLQFLCDLARDKKEKMDMISIQALAVTGKLFEDKMPYKWIGRDLLDSLIHTDPPPDLMGCDIPWPYPSMIVLLPDNAWIDSDGSAILYLAFAHLRSDWRNPNQWAVPVFMDHKEGDPKAEMLCFAMSSIGMIWSSWIPDTKSIGMLKGVTANTYGIDHKPEDDTFSLRLGLLCVNILLYIDHVGLERFDVIEPSTLLRKASATKKTSELWGPSWIGRHYRVKRVTEHGGHHASPRVHWRRGHVRMIPVGPRSVPLKDRPKRQKRIEAVMVNAE